MSCEIRITANVQNISEIRRYLFPTDDERGSDSWLQTCKISVSPAGDLIAIGNERRLVFLTSKWDSVKSQSTFHITYSDCVHEYDKIKALLCLPIVGLSHSSRVGPDWTCVAVGFDSGFVRFYTESGSFLLEEQFHNENITNIKCQSQHSPRPDLCPELFTEEVYIQYQSNVSVIDGQHLFSNLRNCRTQLAKGNVGDTQLFDLNIKKWGFQDQSLINDIAVVGLNMSDTLFDHLLTASTCGGFASKYRNTAPSSTLVLTAGSRPYIGYQYALEGVNQAMLSDVAKVVANKLKSALPMWLTGAKSNQEKDDSVAMQAVDNMALRFGLSDLRRTATDIVLSPNRKLAAVSDTLGRVIVLDCFKGIALTMFKGYREAQCAFLQVPDERRSKHRIGNKVATFLIVYSPKKGTLEIFTLQQGNKIAVFSAAKHSRLIYITHGLVGFTTTAKSSYVCQFTCLFIDNDGQIKEFNIPFHYALAEKFSKKARDIHLYKKLRQLLKCGEFNDENVPNDVFNICSEIKSTEIKSQTVDLLVSCKNVPADLILKCVKFFADNQLGEVDNDVSSNFKVMCQHVISLLGVYLFVVNIDTSDDNGNKVDAENTILNEKELHDLQKLLDLATSSTENSLKKPKVTFSEAVTFNVSDFLTAFDVTKAPSCILKPDTEDYLLYKISEVLFKQYISGERTNFYTLGSIICSSTITLQNIFLLAVHFWVNRPLDINLNLENDMHNFFELMSALVKLANKSGLLVASEDDEVSIFWEKIRHNLANSSRPFPALMAAMLYKNVSQKLELENSEDNIEVLSQENIQWSLLIGKLEDVSTLNIVLSTKPVVNKSVLPQLKYEQADISLKYILENGRGSVSELVAQWLTSCGIDPQLIIINEVIYKNNQNDNATSTGEEEQYNLQNLEDIQISEGMHLELIDKVKSDPIFKYFNLLKQQFPYSLEGSIVLANMCWEYALAWRRSITSLDYLEAAVKCLNKIQNVYIKRGLFELMWNTHLKIALENSCKLINKVGKLPKEKLCQQDTGFSDKQMIKFINICTEFLDSFLNSVEISGDVPRPNLKYEAIWENHGNQPLGELAIQQKDVDSNLLYLHYQLSLLLQMMTALSVKHSKPVNNLFEASIANLLFTDLQRTHDINWNKTDIKIDASRLQFLRKVITSSLETVTLDENNEVYCVKHVEWMQKCITLARIWKLNIDELKRFQIVQLYIGGFDIVAQDLIPAVNESNLLGEELLKVAGKRMSQYLSSSPNLSENIAALNPQLSRFIDTLNGDWCSPCSLPNIKILTSHAMVCLDNNNKEYYKLTDLLLDACETLEKMNSNK